MLKSKFFLALFMAVSLIIPTQALAANKNSVKTPVVTQTTSTQNSTWLWDTQQIVSNSDTILNFAATNNVKNIYLQVNYSLKLDYYKNFIRKAAAKSISVQALHGAPDWASDNGAYKQQQLFDWLTKYQSSALINEKFNGVHLDVEPYLNTQYNQNMNGVIVNYQGLLLDAVSKTNALGIKLAVDVPFWFDGVTYNTKYGTGNLAEWIIKNVKNVVIMAYRDTAAGTNGIISVVSKELRLGKLYGTKVTVGVETQKSSEGDFISFYEEGRACMNQELNKVYISYSGNSSFDGFAIHHVMSWMVLRK
ncbi:hypothetical protein [Clostridium folliculivorans]|uniref:Amidase n=1 Tax=Clostridium folliculivorans TaxID=2886038 RepID=A0A9W5Y4R1_9CLOT|nr:hypothetical protein [Clostridium folliculivorans]GKU26495.1 hypothetical protein CFOLD11_33220 [Clostridium folliculivorans]GKU29073.1 hypothetical protein CFB3_11790 [Clostridium folliculivorans]